MDYDSEEGKQKKIPNHSSTYFSFVLLVLKSPCEGITEVTKGSKAQDLIKNIKEDKWRKASGQGTFCVIAESPAQELVGQRSYSTLIETTAATTGKRDKSHTMIFVRTLGFFFLMTLFIGRAISQGNKAQELKTADKRVDNFRVPVDTSSDPNFWPARGRRGGVSTGSYDYENPTPAEGNLLRDKNNFQCEKNYYLLDVETPINQKYVKDFENVDANNFLEESAEDCYDLPRRPGQSRSLKVCKTRLKKTPNVVDASDFIWLLTNKTEGKRHKQQRYREIPPWFNSEYLVMKPDSSNGEKEKKQDVFWVARGKKSFK